MNSAEKRFNRRFFCQLKFENEKIIDFDGFFLTTGIFLRKVYKIVWE